MLTLGISSCLLGNSVRYDGGHKMDRYITNILGRYVDFFPVCPEVECGLPIPRESMHLEGDPETARLVTTRSNKDVTEQMETWVREKLDILEKVPLCGFIFKTKSPSSGLRDAKIFVKKGAAPVRGPGIFTRAFLKRFSSMPVEDEGRLHDDGLRENFIERIFVYERWRTYKTTDKSRHGFIDFYTNHKLLMMAHSIKHYRSLGKKVAAMPKKLSDDFLDSWFDEMLEGLKLIATVKKNVNVLQHAMGYFKKVLTKAEKAELLDIIEQYQTGLTPLIVPVTILNHYIRKYEESYLAQQFYFNPHPMELKLRNHV